jgi:hypothetical protein
MRPRRGYHVRRIGGIVGWLVLICAAILAVWAPGRALASAWNRDCGTTRDGFVAGPEDSNYNFQYLVRAPWHIRMTAGEVARLARRQPVQEFGTRLQAKDMPCLLALSIAEAGSNAWANGHWHGVDGNAGFTNVVTHTSGGDGFVGTFYCKGNTNVSPPAVIKLTCRMRYRGGAVVGSFTVQNNPQYSGY